MCFCYGVGLVSIAGRAAEAGRQELIYVLSLCQRVPFLMTQSAINLNGTSTPTLRSKQ